MRIVLKNEKYAIGAMVIFTVIMFSIALFTNGTCDDGDSVCHYLFAKYSWIHHENFFNHWAKPFYVLIISPFAQMGFIGVKLFNTSLSCISVWLTYLIARQLKYKLAIAVFPIALFFKIFMVVTFSGLTEPLANFMLTISIFLAFNRKYILPCVIMSFLPFVRSEGLFICGVFALYLIWMRQWRLIPLLFLGHIVYAIAGYSVHKDFLWVFKKIPYARLESEYGRGTWLYFTEKLPQITGVINCVLMAIGAIGCIAEGFYLLSKKKANLINAKKSFLVIMFVVFFLMHSAFWALGIFGSFGLIRVFIAIASVIILIALSGLEYVDHFISRYTRHSPYILAVVLIIPSVFILIGNSEYHYSLKDDFSLNAAQISDRQATELLKSKYPDYHSYHLFFDQTYLGEVLDVDIFTGDHYSENAPWIIEKPFPSKSIILWDQWYSAFEHSAPLQKLRANTSIKEIEGFQNVTSWGDTMKVVVFVSNDLSH